MSFDPNITHFSLTQLESSASQEAIDRLQKAPLVHAIAIPEPGADDDDLSYLGLTLDAEDAESMRRFIETRKSTLGTEPPPITDFTITLVLGFTQFSVAESLADSVPGSHIRLFTGAQFIEFSTETQSPICVYFEDATTTICGLGYSSLTTMPFDSLDVAEDVRDSIREAWRKDD